jgi:DNA polymerase delta subunit 2
MNERELKVRSKTTYESLNDRFAIYPPTLTAAPTSSQQQQQQKQQPYNRQYSSIYEARLNELKPKCLITFEEKYRSKTVATTPVVVSRIIDLNEDATSFMIGTVIKNCPAKPKLDFDTNQTYHENGMSYLGVPFDDDDDNSNGNKIVEAPLTDSTYCNFTNDTVFLEDDSGRIELCFNNTDERKKQWKLDLVTGSIMGIEGKIKEGSDVFEVEDIYYPTLGPHRQVESAQGAQNNDDDACVLFLSGLDCGGNDSSKRNSSTSLKREMLIDYISGYLENGNSQFISRIVVAGGGCAKPIRPEQTVKSWSSSSGNKQDTQQAKDALHQKMNEMTLPIRELDLFLSEVCSNGIPVDYIPGLHDPTNANWPQRPIHQCLVPNANVFTSMLHRTTNPYEASVGDKVLLGSDGLNIFDLRCNLGRMVKDEVFAVKMIDAIESSLKFNHIVPTGPDSVPTFPFETTDPFIIQHAPHVYFCGNCDKFETKLIDVSVDGGSGKSNNVVQVRLICVPSFVKTGQVLIMNLKTLECNVIEIDDVVV